MKMMADGVAPRTVRWIGRVVGVGERLSSGPRSSGWHAQKGRVWAARGEKGVLGRISFIFFSLISSFSFLFSFISSQIQNFNSNLNSNSMADLSSD
jgi:hypothetical protein